MIKFVFVCVFVANGRQCRVLYSWILSASKSVCVVCFRRVKMRLFMLNKIGIYVNLFSFFIFALFHWIFVVDDVSFFALCIDTRLMRSRAQQFTIHSQITIITEMEKTVYFFSALLVYPSLLFIINEMMMFFFLSHPFRVLRSLNDKSTKSTRSSAQRKCDGRRQMRHRSTWRRHCARIRCYAILFKPMKFQ